MKRATILLLMLAASTFPAAAQHNIANVLALIRGKDAVSCSYTFKMHGDMPLEGEGIAVLHGHKYYAEGNGVINYCDGTTLWTVDPAAREVYIENAGGNNIVSNIEKYITAVRDFKYDGSSLSCSIIKPDKKLHLDFSASDIRIIPAEEDGTGYSFDVSTLDSSWVVTDLR